MNSYRVDKAAWSNAIGRGLAPLSVPPPLSLAQWSATHFYLSAESSYVEQAWRAWPFQTAIMACISNDDIREIDWIKAARVGNTKIMLAAVGYYAHHKRRNQIFFQPCDDDRDEFCKTELDPMLRDVECMRDVMPRISERDRGSTLQQKAFIGSRLHLRGGKAAKNYRRISADIAYIDEADAFDIDIEKEGDPITLAAKRIEGATFPTLVVGSTPKLKGFSLIDARVQLAEYRFVFVVPCVHCGDYQPITWGGKDQPHGFKWSDGDPETVAHLCANCGGLMSQGDYLSVWEQGYYRSVCGSVRLESSGEFIDVETNQARPAPRHVAFVDVWTAYSPAATWSQIVRDFLAAQAKAEAGDVSKLKAFVNTTLGQPWELETEGTEADDLVHRAEPYRLGTVPAGGLVLCCGVDTQDNRLELVCWAFGRGVESWCCDHQVFYGNPADAEVWNDLDDYLEKPLAHERGSALKIHAVAIDSRGHNTHAVYDYCSRRQRRRIFAIAGRSGSEKRINEGATKVDIDWRGRLRKAGVMLWHVSTNLAKDLLYSRLSLERPGPGYVHFSDDLSAEFFDQITGERRSERVTARGRESRWTAQRKRVEALDCTVYTLWLAEKLELSRKSQKWWDELEARVAPAVVDMFDQAPAPAAAPAAAPTRRRLRVSVGGQ